MKAKAILRICIWSIIALVLIACTVSFLSGNVEGAINIPFGVSFYHYDNAAEYRVGDTQIKDTVRELDIHWDRGSVTIVAYDGDTITLSEANKSNDKEEQLHWLFKNGTLHIQPRASKKGGRFLYVNGFSSSDSHELTVKIPHSLMTSLSSIEIESTSASVFLTDISTRKLEIDTVSGDVSLINTTAEDVGVSTISGAVSSNAFLANSLEIETTSGNVMLEGRFPHVDADTVSGKVHLQSAVAPLSASFDTTSGDITLVCPEDEGFTLEFDGSRGHFFCDYEVTFKGGRYVSGNGTGRYEVDTVSGKVYIKKP